MRSRVRFPALPWEFSLKGQRNCASWASRPQKSVALLPCPGGRTTKSTRTCGGIGEKKKTEMIGESTYRWAIIFCYTKVLSLLYISILLSFFLKKYTVMNATPKFNFESKRRNLILGYVISHSFECYSYWDNSCCFNRKRWKYIR